MNKNSFKRPVARICIASTLCITLVLGMLLIFSQDARVLAMKTYDSIKSIFVVEKNGDDYEAVEKPDDTVIETSVSTRVNEEEYTIDDLEALLGFDAYLPPKIGKDFNRSRLSMSVSTFVPYNESEAISLQLQEAIFDSSVEEALNQNGYNIRRAIISTYLADKSNMFFLALGKYDPTAGHDNIELYKEFEVSGVDCKIIRYPNPEYPEKPGEPYTSDFSQAPTDIPMTYSVYWQHNDLYYTYFTIGDQAFDEDLATSFAEKYIAALTAQ